MGNRREHGWYGGPGKETGGKRGDFDLSVLLEGNCELRIHWLSLVTILILTCSCSDVREADRYSVRDSAGIRVIENRGPAWEVGTAWWIDPEPSLDLGGPQAADDLQFQQLSSFGVLDSGTFAVADMTTRDVHFFSASGKVLAVNGGKGKGPGEFDALWGLAVLGDRVFAYDPRSARLTVYDSVGGLIETITLENPETSPPLYSYYLVGTTGGQLLLSPRMFTPSPSGAVSLYRDSAPNLLFRDDGRFGGEVAEPSGVDMFVGVQGASAVPFSVFSLIAAADDRVLMSHSKDFDAKPEFREFFPHNLFPFRIHIANVHSRDTLPLNDPS